MSQRLAIVTGASGAIGNAIAKELARTMRVVNWDKHPPAEPDDVPYIACDVSSEDAVREAYARTKAEHGPCAALVNNAGFQYVSPVEDFPLTKWNEIIGVILTGSFLCAKAVVPDMKAQRWGRIVNISSLHGKLASPNKSAYISAKHGLHGLSKTLAVELAGFGVTVNALCPGFVDTPILNDQTATHMKRTGLDKEGVIREVYLQNQYVKELTQPQQIGQWVAFLVSDAASTVTGEAVNLSGGWGMGL